MGFHVKAVGETGEFRRVRYDEGAAEIPRLPLQIRKRWSNANRRLGGPVSIFSIATRKDAVRISAFGGEIWKVSISGAKNTGACGAVAWTSAMRGVLLLQSQSSWCFFSFLESEWPQQAC